MVFGYEESTGIIFDVRGIVVLRFMRTLMTLTKFVRNLLFLKKKNSLDQDSL